MNLVVGLFNVGGLDGGNFLLVECFVNNIEVGC